MNIDKLRAAIAEHLRIASTAEAQKRDSERMECKSDEELLSDLLSLATILAERKKQQQQRPKRTFDDLLARF